MTPAQRVFAREVAKGANYTDAYRTAFPKVKTAHAAESAASRLVRNVEVAEMIAKLKGEAERRAAITRDEIVRDLCAIWKAKPEDATMDNPLCELKVTKAGPVAVFPDKARVVERLAKMLGWDEPERHAMEINVVIGGTATSDAEG